LLLSLPNICKLGTGQKVTSSYLTPATILPLLAVTTLHLHVLILQNLTIV